MEVKLWHVAAGASMLAALAFALHASAEEPPQKKKPEKPTEPPRPASPAPRRGAAPAKKTTAAPVGQHGEAQYKDGQWYGGAVQKSDLSDPDAIKWDAGTAPALANPRTGASPALDFRAAGASPGADAAEDVASKVKAAGADPEALQSILGGLAAPAKKPAAPRPPAAKKPSAKKPDVDPLVGTEGTVSYADPTGEQTPDDAGLATSPGSQVKT